MTDTIHAGHRDRLKQRFLEQGLDGFTDIQVLELLLFYSIPRQDTNPVAHRLLDHFGSLSQVLEASPSVESDFGRCWIFLVYRNSAVTVL